MLAGAIAAASFGRANSDAQSRRKRAWPGARPAGGTREPMVTKIMRPIDDRRRDVRTKLAELAAVALESRQFPPGSEALHAALREIDELVRQIRDAESPVRGDVTQHPR